MSQDVAVIGGGVIGLSTARALAQRGARVTVFDGASRSREASWAAAGILGAGSESAADTPLFRLAREALRSWPETAADLREETGVDVGLAEDGTILVALDAHDVADLEARDRFLRGAGLSAERLSPAGAVAREPALSQETAGALWIREARLDNRRLWEALAASCRRRGVRLQSDETAVDLLTDRERVIGVRTGRDIVRAEAVVLAAGAWSDAIATTTGLPLPTVPVKGQMVRLAAPDGMLRHVVMRSHAYAVPRAGSGIVVGTTAEEVGFERSLDQRVLDGLVRSTARLVPALASLVRAEAWSGFRPRLADGLPAIGPVASRPGLFTATGHYRNGILLCEITGRLVADAVFGRIDPRLDPFSPERPALQTSAGA